VSESGPDRCTCRDCKNFLAARERIYNPQVLELFRKLGIDPQREAEVVIYPLPDRPGYRVGNGWFHVVGRVLEGPPDRRGGTLLFVHTEPYDMDLLVTSHAGLIPDSFDGHPVIQLEWSGPVPWMLDEPPDDGGMWTSYTKLKTVREADT